MSTSDQSKAAQQKVVTDTLARIGSHKGVVGFLVLQPKSGHLLHATGFGDDKNVIEAHREKLHAFLHASHSVVRSLDHNDSLTFLRMRWRQREIIMAPDYQNGEYVLIVVHDHKAAWKSGAQQAAEAVGAGSPTAAGGTAPAQLAGSAALNTSDTDAGKAGAPQVATTA
jgi:dynein light chain roadblock-type